MAYICLFDCWVFPFGHCWSFITVFITFLLNQFILANVFWFVDKAIFKSHFKIPAFYPLWQIKENVVCADCGEICEGYRLVKTKNYDKLSDPQPEFRCKTCREKKVTIFLDFSFFTCRIN